MKKLLSVAIGTLFLSSTTVNADEEYNHFPSLDAPNTKIALCNLAKFNEKLQAIVSKKELTPEDMVKIHELTYTLENAVIRLKDDLDDIAINLERVHLASEHLKQKTIKEAGGKYLDATGLVLKPSECS